MSQGVLMLAHDSMGIEPAKSPVGVDLVAAHAVINDVGLYLDLAHPSPEEGYGASSTIAKRLPFEDILAKLLEFFGGGIGELVIKLGGIEQVAATAQLAYRTYVAPINIPAIPDLVEPIFDNYMELAIGKMIVRAWNIKKLQPTVTPTPTPAIPKRSTRFGEAPADADVPLPNRETIPANSVEP